jgi:hypothetical protein
MRRLIAVLVALAATVVAAPAATAASQPCQAQYQVNEWSGGFTATVTLTAGSTPLTGWAVSWTYPGDQRVTSAWNATVGQSGSSVTATNVAWNGSVPAGGSTQFGLQGTYGQSDAAPANLTVSGCGTQGSPVTSQSEDFEGATTWPAVYPDCQGAGTATLDATVAHSGTHSMRVNGAAGYCNHAFVTPTADLSGIGPVWYGRFYVRHTSALPSQHVTFLALRDAADGNRDLRMGGQNGALQWNRASDDATLPEQSPAGVALSAPLPVNTWTCVEFQVDGAQGHLQTWVDGAAVAGLQADGTPTHDIDGHWSARATGGPTSPTCGSAGKATARAPTPCGSTTSPSPPRGSAASRSTVDFQKCRPAAANGIPWWLVCANRLASVPCSAICRW